MKRAAFFDMDKTVITVNSARLWAEHLYRRGELSKRELLWSATSLLAYHFAVVDMEKVARQGLRRLRGTREDDFAADVRRWYEARIRATIRPTMREAIEQHRADGDEVVLLTASSPYAAQPLAEDLGIEHVLATRFEVRDGIFTGELQTLCYGAGKVTVSQAWAQEHEVDLTHCWFYSDSYTDLPMLEHVGHPVVVAPDHRLRRWAEARGVTIL